MSDDTREEWRPVAEFKGEYEVSDLGRVRSLDRIIICRNSRGTGTHERRHRGRMLRPIPDGHGYVTVKLGSSGGHHIYVLVLEAFVGPRPEGLDGCHGPGGCSDDRLTNLSWGTRAKNNGADRWRDGTALAGARNHQAKLTWADVDEIRRRAGPLYRGNRPKGAPPAPASAELAAEFGVDRSTIRDIVAGVTWRPEARRHAS